MTLLLWIALAGVDARIPAGAQPRSDAAARAQFLDELFEGIVIGVIAHEIGHALVHQLALPVLGSEEAAADDIGTSLLLGDLSDQENIKAAASGVVFMAMQVPRERGSTAGYWDAHGFSAQRMVTIACLVYGAAPERHEALARSIPEPRRAGCADETQQKLEAFEALMGERYRPYRRRTIDAGDPAFRLAVAPPRSGAMARLAHRADALRPRLEQFLEDMSQRIDMPRDVPVVLRDCPTANAYYVRRPGSAEGAIVLCWQLLDQVGADLAALARRR